jgi:small multidrug resistance family-3 protein
MDPGFHHISTGLRIPRGMPSLGGRRTPPSRLLPAGHGDAMSTTMGITVVALASAAALEVCGDYLIRKGLPSLDWTRMLAGAVLLALYGFAVNLWWHGDFSKLLGLYVVLFFVASQVWGVVLEGERLDAARLVGGGLIVAGGLVIQLWRAPS